MSMKIGNMELSVGSIVGVLTIVGMLFGSWFFADGYFAHSSDLRKLETKDQVMEWSTEQSMNSMRMDITEDRIWREKQKPVPDAPQIQKWEGQVEKYEIRQQHLEQMQDQLKLKSIDNR